jgi:hypothetical protein
VCWVSGLGGDLLDEFRVEVGAFEEGVQRGSVTLSVSFACVDWFI